MVAIIGGISREEKRSRLSMSVQQMLSNLLLYEMSLSKFLMRERMVTLTKPLWGMVTLLCWNVRGLNGLNKQREVMYLCKQIDVWASRDQD
ncbi:hypothetical protein KY290_000061 [Solanum tuberosum]|uniref:Uncharacterized protein n=1 Tax=Solanum tuberosum TaxID=4113 RepID=A0ABQ7WKA3_SOLTU|nr:hypothetical protein KY290_000061 [Solanum tuberosum]